MNNNCRTTIIISKKYKKKNRRRGEVRNHSCTEFKSGKNKPKIFFKKWQIS